MAFDWRSPERVSPWKPRQRFQVMARGHEAQLHYRARMEEAQRSDNPRSALEVAKQSWAEEYRLKPEDGIVLDDMVAGNTSLSELHATLEACNLTLRDARGSLDRMRAAGLVEPLEEQPRT